MLWILIGCLVLPYLVLCYSGTTPKTLYKSIQFAYVSDNSSTSVTQYDHSMQQQWVGENSTNSSQMCHGFYCWFKRVVLVVAEEPDHEKTGLYCEGDNLRTIWKDGKLTCVSLDDIHEARAKRVNLTLAFLYGCLILWYIRRRRKRRQDEEKNSTLYLGNGP